MKYTIALLVGAVTSVTLCLTSPEAIKKEPINGVPKYITSCEYTPEEDEIQYPTTEEILYMVKCVHGEAGICDDLQKSYVAWCILNRVDCKYNGKDNIVDVITDANQFHGYSKYNKYTQEEWCLCYKIIYAWKNYDDRYRTLPSNYLYFLGDGKQNYFFTTFYPKKQLDQVKKYSYDGRMGNPFDQGED